MQAILKPSRRLLKNYLIPIKHNVQLHKLEIPALSLAPGYQPQEVEINNLPDTPLEAKLVTQRKIINRGPFRMLLPPPNVTGDLHLGHALMAIVQDVLCRYHHNLGYDVEWIPGTDHAGIATQVVVEKQLFKKLGITRHDLGREKFLEHTWQWKNEKGLGILDDLKKLGCMLTWNKEYFTMNEQQIEAVQVAFIKLFEDGLITRKNSLVNWSCALESAVSDMEVETIELKGPTDICVPGYQHKVPFGNIYEFSYRLCNQKDEIIVSTTRPETMLGDVAVAVHPDDPRYIKYRNIDNVSLWHPFRQEPIPLIFDINVDPDFGSGAVKITPAHDQNDFQIAESHLLKSIPVFTSKGTVVEGFEVFKGIPRFKAREKILNILKEMQLLRTVKPHAMNLPICSRSKDIIEYMLCPQWYLHCQPMANEAMSEIRSGRVQIVPSNFELDWYHWLEDCHDWCISRQLWWGHQIPAYEAVDSVGKSCWVAAKNEVEARAKAQNILNTSDFSIRRDEDVLDTWFSSALLPFSIHNWPAVEYKQHYPLDLMETGHDILFFWVARMAMLGLKLTGEMPFKKILLHGIVCDAHGRKMSKSLGNIVTPQQVIQGASLQSMTNKLQKAEAGGTLTTEEYQKSEKGLQKMFPNGIKECGTDALRFTLCSHNIKSHFINFDIDECYTNKLFLNKIWQATRFTLISAQNLKFSLDDISTMHAIRMNKWDKWILSRLAYTLEKCDEGFKTYNLHYATAALKTFFYNNLCDVFLETTKEDIKNIEMSGYMHLATLTACLVWGLRAMQPFTPFIAKELLLRLPENISMNTKEFQNTAVEAEISKILEICQHVRQLKSQNQISKKHAPKLYLYAQNDGAKNMLNKHLSQIKALTMVDTVDLDVVTDALEANTFNFYSTGGHLCVFGLTVNETYQAQTDKLEFGMEINKRKLEKLQAELQRYRLRVNNEGFMKSASKKVQEKSLEKIKQLEVEIQNILNLRR
ncbi:probable valine--tRNA ligase, cytoplasmic [Teleopsis dalmanni]|uniref:probable valine--tRNA ligase, cytoplasmic n=1 Tax=Teleopsis dalmanni TaxID=139649 RepID=UPI0018CE8B5C|nr:probable valine--tRNA ligase, cytoplasmic [Teleopsis dalmanni]